MIKRMNNKALFYQLFICVGWFLYEDSVDWNVLWRSEIQTILDESNERDEKKC